MQQQARRTASETLWLHLLMHIGFTKPLLSEVPIRNNTTSFSKRSIERASELITRTFAYKESNWPIKPVSRIPGKSISSNDQLIEMSLLASSMKYLYGERIYEGLLLNEVIKAFDLYTNMRSIMPNTIHQISPDNAYWMSREIFNHYATVPYCEACGIHYYSSIEQKIINGCPFCKTKGIGDHNGAFIQTSEKRILNARKKKYG